MSDQKANEYIESFSDAAIRELLDGRRLDGSRVEDPPAKPSDLGEEGALEVTHVVPAGDKYKEKAVLIDLDHPAVREMSFDTCDIKDFRVKDRTVRAYVSYRVGLSFDKKAS